MLHTFQFSSGRIRYKVSGRGPLLILLHGFGGNDQDWAECAPRFEPYFTVVMPNLLNVYMPTTDRLSFRKQAEVIGGFIAEIRVRFADHIQNPESTTVSKDPSGTDRVFLAGTSYGGALAWGATILFPNLVHRLILVNAMPSNPIAYFQNRGLRLLLRLARVPSVLPFILHSQLGLQLLREVETLFQVPWIQHTKREKMARWTDRKARVVGFALARFSSLVRTEKWKYWDENLPRIDQPVLIITAKQDSLFEMSSLRQWHQTFVTKVLCDLDGTHMVTRDEPELVAETIIEFSQYEFVNQIRPKQKTA